MSLLKWALIMLVVSVVAAIFGFSGLAAASADIARILFYIFLVIFLVLLVLGLMGARAARGLPLALPIFIAELNETISARRAKRSRSVCPRTAGRLAARGVVAFAPLTQTLCDNFHGCGCRVAQVRVARHFLLDAVAFRF